MIELIWAWRVWFKRISINDVPEPIRPIVSDIVKKLEWREV